jgi:tetratricopeptide (TPR) repeat protein
LFFLIIRHRVLGNVNAPIPFIDNYLVGITDFVSRKCTAIFLMGIYLKLFFFPHPLCSDGSFNHFPTVGFTDWRFLVPFILYAGMALFAIMGFRKKNLFSFGILYFFLSVSIISNLIVPIGTNYAERLLFTPSLAFCFCLAVLLQKIFQKDSRETSLSVGEFFRNLAKPIGITAVVMVLFSVKTFSRNADWYDSAALYHKDIETVPNSVHMGIYMVNYMTSDEELDLLPDSAARTAKMFEAIKILNHCLDIYPDYADAFQARGHLLYLMKDFKNAEPDFQKAIELNKTNFISQNNYGNLLFKSGRFEEAMQHYQMAILYYPDYSLAVNNIGSVYGIYGQYQMQLATTDPAHKEEHMAEAKKQFETAIPYFLKAIKLDPEYVDPYNLISITYRVLGDNANADKYAALMQQAKARKEKIKAAKN